MTLRCSLYGGPGSGKSTSAAILFGRLKQNNVNAELVGEFAKDLMWSSHDEALAYQPLITGEQQWREQRVEGKVDVLVSDTSSLLGLVYQDSLPEAFDRWVVREYLSHNRLSVFLRRDPNRPYNPAGRSQTEEEAQKYDDKILRVLGKFGIPFVEIQLDKYMNGHIDEIYKMIERRLDVK